MDNYFASSKPEDRYYLEPFNSNYMEVVDNGYKCRECNEHVPLRGSCTRGCSNIPENLVADVIERPKSIHALISKFPNGQERMRTSALFSQVLHSLAEGADPLAIIDHLITITKRTQNEFEKHIRACPGPPIVISPQQTKVMDDYEHNLHSKWRDNNNNWEEPMIKHFQD